MRVARRIVVSGVSDAKEVAELLLSIAEGTGARGFQYRELGGGALEVLLDGEDGLAEDMVALISEIWPGSKAYSEEYKGKVMELELFKRVLYTREHPEESLRRRLEGRGRRADIHIRKDKNF